MSSSLVKPMLPEVCLVSTLHAELRALNFVYLCLIWCYDLNKLSMDEENTLPEERLCCQTQIFQNVLFCLNIQKSFGLNEQAKLGSWFQTQSIIPSSPNFTIWSQSGTIFLTNPDWLFGLCQHPMFCTALGNSWLWWIYMCYYYHGCDEAYSAKLSMQYLVLILMSLEVGTCTDKLINTLTQEGSSLTIPVGFWKIKITIFFRKIKVGQADWW